MYFSEYEELSQSLFHSKLPCKNLNNAFYFESYVGNMKVQALYHLNHKSVNAKEKTMDCWLYIFERQLVIQE